MAVTSQQLLFRPQLQSPPTFFSLLPYHSLRTISFPSLNFPTLFLCNSLSPLTISPTSKQNPVFEDEDEDLDKDESYYSDEIDYEDEDDDEEEELEVVVEKKELEVKVKEKRVTAKPPSLSIKEKKELASYAHGLGDKLKSQLVGKSGVTDSVAVSFVENLESNELLKIKIHRTCPGELPEVVEQLEKATGSVVVGQVGRTVILYRPSLTKLKAEEKKLQNRKVFVRKSSELKPMLPSRKKERIPPGPAQAPRRTGRGRRGASRVSDASSNS